MKKLFPVFLAALFLLSSLCVALAAEPPKDERKSTKAALYVTAKEAYDAWNADKDGVKIIDCRTPEEYVFVGHAPMAYNIPSKFFTMDFNAEKKEYVLKDNEAFVDAAKKLFKADDVIMVMCRSGHRSAPSVNKLTEAGFTKVYNIIDGFEGDVDTAEQSPTFGLRTVNGWKNSKIAITYALDQKLVYQVAK